MLDISINIVCSSVGINKLKENDDDEDGLSEKCI